MATSLRQAEDRRPMWRTTIAMFVAGGSVLLATLPAAFDPDTSDHGWMKLGAVLAFAFAAIVAAAGPHPLVLRASPFVGIAMVSLLVAVARPVISVPLFYLWPIFAAAFYLSPRGLAAALGFFYATFGAALLVSHETEIRMLLFIGGTASSTLAAIVVSRLQQRLNAVMDELRRSAASDPLTGLLNRRGFEAAFDRDLGRAERLGIPLTLVTLDLDHFKRLNDTQGHAAGDDALTALAAVLRREARGSDAVARIGGEEFAVLLSDAGVDGALNYVERVAAAAPLALSAGVATLSAQTRTREGLMLAADRALYAAKDAGRGRVVVAGGLHAARPLARAA